MANEHGGSRSNAGRKPKATKHQTAIQKAEKKIADKLPTIIERLLELGEGVLVEEPEEGKPRVYKRIPDRKALEYLANRVMGRPTERVDMNHTGSINFSADDMAAAAAEVKEWERQFNEGTKPSTDQG